MTAPAVPRRAIEDVLAAAEETAAQVQRMVMRLTAYTDHLENLRDQAHRGVDGDG